MAHLPISALSWYPAVIRTHPPAPAHPRLWRLCAWLGALALALPLGGPPAPLRAAPSIQAADPVAVLIYLSNQPFTAEAAARQGAFQAQAAAAAARVAAAALPPATAAEQALTEAQEAAAAATQTAVDPARLQQALNEFDALAAAQRREVFQAAQPALAASQAPVEALVARLGGTVTVRLSVVNALGVRVPPGALAALRRHPSVAEVVLDTPAVSALETSPASLGAPTFWNAGYAGGVFDLAVVDTGVDDTHPALAAHNFAEGRFLSMAGASASGDPTADDINGHGTHVAGIAGGTTAPRLGVAYGFDALLNAKAGYDPDGAPGGASSMFQSDSMAAVEWALFSAPHSAEVINLSFAACANSVDDDNWARFFDAVVGATGVTVAVAAGNAGGGCTRVTSPSIAHNVISVANIDDQGTSNRAGDTINPGSLPGPTVAGRRKPDLAAPGTNINSANAAWEGANPDYHLLTGTSMAAPHIAGAALLLMQAGVTDPRAIKALLINTAEDLGDPGWDELYGWGYVDLSQAFIHRGDTHLGSVSNAAPYRLFKGPALAGDRATLAWHRHVTYPCATTACSQTIPVTNLNLSLYAAANNALLATDLTAVASDTVEQVRAPAASPLNVVRVSLASIDGALSHEDFALATEEGFTPAVGPALTNASIGSVAPVGVARPVSLRLANPGDLPAHGVVVTVTIPADVGLTPGTDVFNVGFLDAGSVFTTVYTPTLQVDASRYFNVSASGTGYGLSLSLAGAFGVHPEHARDYLPYWVVTP